MLLLRGERGLQHCDRALAVRVRALVLERGLEIRAPPAGRRLGDLRDRQLVVVLRGMRRARGRRCGRLYLRGGGLRGRLRLRRRLGLLRWGSLLRGAADRLDLDLRQAAAVAVVLPVARALLVLADPDLLAELMAEHAGRHGRRRREVGRPVAADQEDARREGLALTRRELVDEQPLALSDAVLLTADGDDRVAHRRGKRGHRARESVGSVANPVSYRD